MVESAIMSVKYIKFVIFKLILVLFAAIGAALVCFLLSATMPESTDTAFRTAVISVAPSVVFFAFIHSFESKIKIPGDTVLSAKYYILFTLRETSVYAIFLIPLTVLTAVLGKDILNGGTAACFLLPHLSPVRYGVPIPVSFVICCVLYAAICFNAHRVRSKKSAPIEAVSFNETEILSDEESEN